MSKPEQTAKTDGVARDARAQSDGVVGVVITVVLVAIVALVGVMIVSSLVTGGIGPSGDSVSYAPSVNETEVIDTEIEERPDTLSVRLTKEQGVKLDGEGDGTRSYIEFSDGGQVVTEGGNWTLMASGRLDESANPNATYNLLAVENETVTLAYSDGEWVATYLKSDTESAQARLPANNANDSYTTLGVRYNNETEELTLERNGQSDNTTNLTAENPPREIQLDWYGSVDDYRFSNESFSDSELDRLAAEPTAGTNVNTTARYMLDDGSGSSSSAFYSSGEATLVNAAWTDGLSDQMQEEVDYEVTFDPLGVTTIGGGLADGSPVIYVQYDSGLSATVAALVNGFGSAISLIPVLLISLVAGVIITFVARIKT